MDKRNNFYFLKVNEEMFHDLSQQSTRKPQSIHVSRKCLENQLSKQLPTKPWR